MGRVNNRFKVVVATLITLVLIAALFTSTLFRPVDQNSTKIERFVIPKGQAISIIGQRLQDEGLIRSALAFRAVVIRDNLANKIQAGSFDLSSSMSLSEVAERLTTGTEDTWITILEGWRVEEIAESLDTQDLDNFDKDEFIDLAKPSEGMLYPDTYLIPREMSGEQIYRLLLNTFDRKVSQELEGEIESSDKDFDQILIMASLIEREARTFEQMRRVSGILWNRIDIGMALQVDATLQYANGYNKLQQTWWAVPTSQDKQIQSPFNTYLNPGLPPKPIANPGLNAIKAALDPLESDGLYYIHANDGNMYYSATLEGHNANIIKYLR